MMILFPSSQSGSLSTRLCFSFLAFAVALSPFDAVSCSADEIKLRRGGSLSGKVVKKPEANNGFYEIELSSGASIQIAKREVDSIVKPQFTVTAYQAELANHDLATVQGHMEMVDWCTKNKLRLQKSKHLRQVIELDPEHEQARRLLGYTRHILSGKWVLRDEYYQSIGYVRDGSAMRLPQAQRVEQEERKHRDALNAWKGKIPRLITLLKNQRKFAEAKQELQEIDDVKAIPVMIDYYKRIAKKRQQNEFDRQVKSMLMGIISKFDILSARLFLVDAALNEPDDVLQDEAEQYLRRKHAQWTADYLIARLNRIPPSSNTMIHDRDAFALQNFINRAAVLLENLEDADVSESILPLINVIYVKRILVPLSPQKKGGLGGATFDSNGGVGMNQGSKKPEPRPVEIRNGVALTVLKNLTERQIQYDKSQWLSWYLSRTLPTKIDLRRLD